MAQSWQWYFSGQTVYEVDVRDSLVVAGLDFQIAVYNINTGQTSYHMPTTSLTGEGFPILNVGIDTNNSIWIDNGTLGNGLYEYNGTWNNYTSTNSSLPHDYPKNIYVNHTSNRIWVDVANQKATFDGITYSPIGPYPGDCEEHNDTLWIANTNGLVEYVNGTTTIYDPTLSNLSSNDIRHVAIDGNNKVWFTMRHIDTITWTPWYTLGSYDGTNWNEYDTTNSSIPFLWEPKKLQTDTNNTLVISVSNGLIEFDGVNAVIFNSDLGNFPDIWLNSLHIDDSGNRWLSTRSNGLLRMNGGVIDTIPTSENILNSSRSSSVLVASDGKKWFALNDGGNPTFNNGVFMLDNNNVWTSFEQEVGGAWNSPYVIEEDALGNIFVVCRLKTMKYDGTIWTETACGGGGLFKTDIAFDNFGNYWKAPPQNFIVKCNDSVYEAIGYGSIYNQACVEVDFANNVWIGAQGTIVKIDQNENITTYGQNEIGVSLSIIYDIEFDSQQHLWAVSEGNLINFDGTNWTIHPFPEIGYLTDLEIDNNNNIWVSFLGGISYFDGSNWIIFDNSNSFFIDNYVREISLDIPNNTIWGATQEGGVFSFTNPTLISGIDEKKSELKANVYPNPATDKINIDIDATLCDGAIISLLNLNGTLIKKLICSSPNAILDISNITPGFYLIKVSNNGFATMKKIVII